MSMVEMQAGSNSRFPKRLPSMMNCSKNFFAFRSSRRLGSTLTLLVLSILIALHPPLFAQVNFGGITGQVEDYSGAVLSTATVIATNNETHAERKVPTNREGFYDLASLTPGTYTLEVTASGFRRAQSSITVTAGMVTTQNFTLAVGRNAAEVMVVANSI